MFDLIPLIKAIGYFGIFSIAFVESGILIGFFLPGDSLVFTVGFLASQGYLSLVPAIIAMFLGAVIGDSVGYSIGKKFGPAVFKKEDALFLGKENIERARDFYERHGGKTIILARFIPFIRSIAPVMAGVGKMNYFNFLTYNIFGGALWAISLSLIGYYLGEIIPNADRYILLIIASIIIISVAPVAIKIFRNKEYRKKIITYLRGSKKL